MEAGGGRLEVEARGLMPVAPSGAAGL